MASRSEIPINVVTRPNTNIDSVAEIRKKLILMLWPSLRLQNEINASWAEEAEPMKCP
jgi:hypothetical protein